MKIIFHFIIIILNTHIFKLHLNKFEKIQSSFSFSLTLEKWVSNT